MADLTAFCAKYGIVRPDGGMSPREMAAALVGLAEVVARIGEEAAVVVARANGPAARLEGDEVAPWVEAPMAAPPLVKRTRGRPRKQY